MVLITLYPNMTQDVYSPSKVSLTRNKKGTPEVEMVNESSPPKQNIPLPEAITTVKKSNVGNPSMLPPFFPVTTLFEASGVSVYHPKISSRPNNTRRFLPLKNNRANHFNDCLTQSKPSETASLSVSDDESSTISSLSFDSKSTKSTHSFDSSCTKSAQGDFVFEILMNFFYLSPISVRTYCKLKLVKRSSFQRWLSESTIQNFWDPSSMKFNASALVISQLATEYATSAAYKNTTLIERERIDPKLEQERRKDGSVIITGGIAKNMFEIKQDDQLMEQENGKRQRIRLLGNNSEANHPLIQEILLNYIDQRTLSEISIREFIETSYPDEISKSTLSRWLNQSGIAPLMAGTVTKDIAAAAKATVWEWLKSKENEHQMNCHRMGVANRHLTDTEECVLLKTVQSLGTMTHGITIGSFRKMAGQMINFNSKDQLPSRSYLYDLRSRHPEYPLFLRQPKWLDQARATQANEHVRNAYFTEIEELVKTLKETGKAPWRSPAEIPSSCIFNMDEVGLDTSKGLGKIFVCPNKNKLVQTNSFLQTKEGDKMSRHITICLTSCANGERLIF